MYMYTCIIILHVQCTHTCMYDVINVHVLVVQGRKKGGGRDSSPAKPKVEETPSVQPPPEAVVSQLSPAIYPFSL